LRSTDCRACHAIIPESSTIQRSLSWTEKAVWKHSHAKKQLAAFYSENCPLNATDIHVEATLRKYTPQLIESLLLKKYGVTTSLKAQPNEPMQAPAPIPIKPMYAFFCDSVRDRVKAENPGASLEEIASLIGSKWQFAKKQETEVLAEIDKTRYTNEMRDWFKRGENQLERGIRPSDLTLPPTTKKSLKYFADKRYIRQQSAKSYSDLHGSQATCQAVSWGGLRPT
jgi:hypothetical protein